MNDSILQQYEIMLVLVLVLMTMVVPELVITKAKNTNSEQSFDISALLKCDTVMDYGELKLPDGQSPEKALVTEGIEKVQIQLTDKCDTLVFLQTVASLQANNISVSIK